MSEGKTIRSILRQYKINLISFLEKNQAFNSIFSNPLWKGALILGTGSILTQIINFLGIIFITRLYSPSDFGLLGIFSAIISVFITFTSFGYELAIPVPKDSETAAHLLVLSILLVCLSSLVFFILLILFGSYFVTIFNLQIIAPFFGLLLISCLSSGIYQVLNYWAIRKQDYISITYTQINQSLSGNLCKIFFGIIGIGSLGLLLGQVISYIAGIGTFIKKIRLSDRNSIRSISFSGLKYAAREYRNFPIFSAPAALVLTLSLQFPIFFISIFYGIKEVGWYSLANQMLSLPIYLIGLSISQAYYGEAAVRMHNNPFELKAIYLNLVKILTLISIPVIGIIALLAPFIFPIIFGVAWFGAGVYCIPLALVAISEFITTPTNKLSLYGFNKWQLGFHIFRFILIFIGFFISYLLNIDILLSLFLYGCIIAFTCIILFYLNMIAINRLILNFTKIK